MANIVTEIKTNQIWKENDPRKERYVRVTRDGGAGDVEVETCGADGERVKGARKAWAKRDRFNGKRGGYTFIKEIAV